MAGSNPGRGVAWLLILALASSSLADEYDGRGKDVRLHACQDYFYKLEDPLESCHESLAARVAASNATGACPQPCPGLLKAMPTYCGQQLAPALRSSYDLSLLDSSGRPLDICAVFCGSAEQCTVDAALLPRLDVLHQLHDEGSTLWALAAQGNGNGNGSRSGSGSGGSEGGNGSGNGSGGDGSGSSGGNSGDGGGDDDSAGGQQGNATTAGSPAAAPAADDDGGSGVNVAAVAAGTVAGTVALALAGFAVWRMRRRRRQPAAAAAAAADEADDHGKPGPDLEAGWAAGQGKSPQDKKQQQQQQQQHQQQQRSDVDSAASTPSSSPAAASTQEAAPDGLEGLAALWAQAAQAAAPAAAAGATGAAGAAAAGTAAGRQPQDSAWRGDQPGRDRRASGAAEAAGGSSPDVTAGSSELTAPSTPAGELQRGASRRGSQGMSGTTSAAMDLERWEVDFSAISLLRLLGEGSCGSVYLATLNETAVAVKLLAGADPAAASAGSWRSSPALQALHKESSLMAALRHPNVVMFLGISYEPPAIISEYCARGSLFDVLHSANSSEATAASLTWPRRLRLALDAAKGMLALHSHQPPIIHRDLKSPNLLVDGAWRVKVADFNLSKLLEDTGVRSTSLGGMLNPRWLAPEVLTGGSASAASDSFSMGVVLWELMTWTIPWGDRNLFQLVHMVSGGERLAVPAREAVAGAAPDPELYAAYVALIRRCWAQQPEQRPGFAEIIQDLRAMMAYAVAPFDAAA